jgi:trk system potassium uptake protein TrkA
MVDYLELTPDFTLVEVLAPHSMDNKTLKELNIRAKYGCNIVAIRRKDNSMNVSPPADAKIYDGDMLIVIGNNSGIGRFEKGIEE